MGGDPHGGVGFGKECSKEGSYLERQVKRAGHSRQAAPPEPRCGGGKDRLEGWTQRREEAVGCAGWGRRTGGGVWTAQFRGLDLMSWAGQCLQQGV